MPNRIKEDYNNYYDAIKLIGSGGYGRVYLEKDKKTKKIRAIKIIDLNKIKDDLISSYMINEIRDYLKNYIDGFIREFNIMNICAKTILILLIVINILTAKMNLY